MKVNLLLILLVFGQNFVFGQEKSEREISKSVIVIEISIDNNLN